MMMQKVFRGVGAGLLAVALLLGAGQGEAAGAALPEKPVNFEVNGERVQLNLTNSRFYAIYSNIHVSQLKTVGAHMDAVYLELQRRFATFKPKAAEYQPMYLFKTREQFVAFMRLQGINAEPARGLFFVNSERQGLATWMQGNRRSEMYRTLQHEGFHQFAFNHIAKDIPIWVNEGLAQCIQDGVLVNGNLRLGYVNADRLFSVRHAYANDLTLDFNDFLSLTDQAWLKVVERDSRKSSILYDHAWSLMHVITQQGGDQAIKDMQALLQMCAAGKPVEEAVEIWKKKVDIAKVERDWEKFVERGEADPLSTAVERMEFMGSFLEYLRDKKFPIPTNMDKLRANMRKVEYRLEKIREGVSREYKATDDAIFHYGFPGKTLGMFEFLVPEQPNLLPRISAPKLKAPRPMLVWYMEDGELVQDIVYLP